MPDKVLIFDTTLRDGEQSPGASMNQEEKLSIARLLEELKVDIIEAGFPIASKGDFNSVQAIASEIKAIIGLSLGFFEFCVPDPHATLFIYMFQTF